MGTYERRIPWVVKERRNAQARWALRTRMVGDHTLRGLAVVRTLALEMRELLISI